MRFHAFCVNVWSEVWVISAAVASPLTGLLFFLLLSGESATVAPRPNSECRFCLSGFYQSSPLPPLLISNLVPFPQTLYIKSVCCDLPNQTNHILCLSFEGLINFFPLKCKKQYTHLTYGIKNACLDLSRPKISCFVHINTRIVGGHQVRGTDGSWVVSIQIQWVISFHCVFIDLASSHYRLLSFIT